MPNIYESRKTVVCLGCVCVCVSEHVQCVCLYVHVCVCLKDTVCHSTGVLRMLNTQPVYVLDLVVQTGSYYVALTVLEFCVDQAGLSLADPHASYLYPACLLFL